MVTVAAMLMLGAGLAPAAARHGHQRAHAAPARAEVVPPKPMAAADVPLPKPRPGDAPQRAAAKESDKAADGGKDEVAAAPPPPSACRLALTEELALAPSVPPIKGPGGCGGEDLVRLESIVLPDKRRVALSPAATMRCSMATALVNWVRDDAAPELAKLGSAVTTLANFDAYQCRGRNGASNGPLSEHGRANAIDIHGFKLADGRMIDLTDRTQPRELRESLLRSACTRFPTVLGPDSDWHHEDHIHVDLIERRSGYRICQWDVLDPMPQVAPLMPEARPEEAPPRAVAQAEEPVKEPGKPAEPRAAARDAVKDPSEAKSSADTPDRTASVPPTGKAAKGDSAKGDSEKGGSEKGDSAKGSSAKASDDKQPAANRTDTGTADSKPANSKPVDSKPAESKPAETRTRAEKAAADKAFADKAAADKSSARKMATDRPTQKKRRHSRGRRDWNPFGALF